MEHPVITTDVRAALPRRPAEAATGEDPPPSGRAAGEASVVLPGPPAETSSDRAVRCALGWGVANLRLAKVAEVVETWREGDPRARIIAALDGWAG